MHTLTFWTYLLTYIFILNIKHAHSTKEKDDYSHSLSFQRGYLDKVFLLYKDLCLWEMLGPSKKALSGKGGSAILRKRTFMLLFFKVTHPRISLERGTEREGEREREREGRGGRGYLVNKSILSRTFSVSYLLLRR